MGYTVERMKVHELFKLARVLQNRTQDFVAGKAEISRATLAQFEAGKPAISVGTMREIATVLNISPEWLEGTSSNRFRSKEMIHFYVDGKDRKADLAGLFAILPDCRINEIVLLTASPGTVVSRLRWAMVQETLVAALLMQDFDYNVFLVSMKRPGYFLGYQEDLAQAIGEASRKAEKDYEVVVRSHPAATDLLLKIQQRIAEKEDFERFFGLTYTLQTGRLKKVVGGKIVYIPRMPLKVLRRDIEKYLRQEDDAAYLKSALREMVMIGLMAEKRLLDREEYERRLRGAHDAYGLPMSDEPG